MAKFDPIFALRNAIAAVIDGDDAETAIKTAKEQIASAKKLQNDKKQVIATY